MSVVKVVSKSSEIDGKPIVWSVLSITGYMQDDFQTLELKLSKTEAMLAKLLLATEGSTPSVEARRSTDEEKDGFFKKNSRSDDDKFNLDEDD